MRKLLFLMILGAALWSGYWYVGSTAIQREAEKALAQAEAGGLVVDRSSLSVSGFPNRFDVTVNDLNFADPTSAIGWQAPFVQVFAMTWKPWHIIAALPPEQKITTPDQQVTLVSDGLRASLRSRPATDLPLAAAIVEANSFTATTSDGLTFAAARSVASISADEEVENAGDAPNAYVIALDMADVTPDPEAIQKIVTEAGLPPSLSVVKVLATATLTAPLDRYAGEVRPQLSALDLTDSLVTWGDLSIAASGKIAPDDQGFAAGRIEIAVTNYQRLVPALVAAGAIKPELEKTVGNMLSAMAQQTGDPNRLTLPLVLSDGRVSLGPLPLGEAPRLVAPSG